MVHTFNLGTREVETGRDMLGGERNIKGKRKELTGVCSLSIHGDRVSPFRDEDWYRKKVSLVVDCFAFLIFSLNPSICLFFF